MATSVHFFRANDGTLHDSEAAADALNLRLANEARVNAYVSSLSFPEDTSARGAAAARTRRAGQILDFLVWEQTPRTEPVVAAAEPVAAEEPAAEVGEVAEAV